MKISVVIIAFNEADRIEDALISCKGVADEIVVVDSFSTDNTVKIAESYGAVVYQNRFIDYGNQKNFALQKAANDWVLNLDADERISDVLKEELFRLKSDGPGDVKGFKMPRKTAYLGRWITHSGWYPDKKLRLFYRDSAEWTGRIHERLVVNGAVSDRLSGDILHYTYRDISDHIARLNRYSKMQAEDMSVKGKRFLLLRALLMPPITFLRFYIWKLGILDRFPGLVIALVSSWATSMKYLKTIEINRNNKKKKPISKG